MTVRSNLGPFGMVTVAAMDAINSHPDGTPTVLAVYVALSTTADREESQAWRSSVKAIADRAGVSERSVRTAKRVLTDLGLLEVDANWTVDGDRGWDSYLLHYTPADGAEHKDAGTEEVAAPTAEVAVFSSDQETDQVTESVAAFSVDSPAHQLCTQLADHIEQLGAKRPTITNTWLTDMDRAIRIDKRTPEQLAACIRWLSTPNRDAQFWSTNILSPKKLRANFDKMALQARAAKQPHRAPTPIEQAREMMAQRNAARQRSQGEGMVLGMTHGEQQ